MATEVLSQRMKDALAEMRRNGGHLLIEAREARTFDALARRGLVRGEANPSVGSENYWLTAAGWEA